MKDFLEVKNLCYAYIKKPLCLKDVNFSVAEKDKILILASKNQGKTTLINSLAGFDNSYFGQVLYKNKDLKKISDEDKNFSIIYEKPVLIDGSIDKNINFLYETLKREIPDDEQKKSLLEKFGINRGLTEKIKKLSLIEKFKLCFLRVFIKNSSIVFIDNIFGNFSDCEKKELFNVIDIAVKDKTSIICADEKSLKAFTSEFEMYKFNKVLYLNNAIVSSFNSIFEFQNSLVDLNSCEFANNINKIYGYCVYQDGDYYLNLDEKFIIKIDKMFNKKFDALNLADGENEDIVLVKNSELDIDFSKNNDFNEMLKKQKFNIFSKLTGIKVL